MKKKILIIEDTPSNVKILRLSLEDDNSLEAAASGEEALEIAPRFKPDIILLDIMMPGIDGYETCRRLRALPELKDTKIIMVSAKILDEDIRQSYAAGADDFLGKPFTKEELLEKTG